MRLEEATPGAVAVEQHLDHHPGMVGRAAPVLALVAGGDGREVQLVHHVGDEVGQVILGQPLLEGRRQQQLLAGIVGTEGLAHQRLRTLDVPPIIPAIAQSMAFLGRAARTIATLQSCVISGESVGRSFPISTLLLCQDFTPNPTPPPCGYGELESRE